MSRKIPMNRKTHDSPPPGDDDAALTAKLKAGDRAALARAVSLIESRRCDHRRRAAALVETLAACRDESLRIAITGPPGAGKSTLIDRLGRLMIAAGRRVAVLAIDPSSRSGGSLLGDKTRMDGLARCEAAFIRPSPSGGVLGGVAASSRAAATLCAAAGYDRILIESVGVGQSETAAADMSDCCILVLPPDGGDDLQAMKKGVREAADLLVVNKADAYPAAAAATAAIFAQGSFAQGSPEGAEGDAEGGAEGGAEGEERILTLTALREEGVETLLLRLEARLAADRDRRRERRRRQDRLWARALIEAGLREALFRHAGAGARLRELEAAMDAGSLTAPAVARHFLEAVSLVVEGTHDGALGAASRRSSAPAESGRGGPQIRRPR